MNFRAQLDKINSAVGWAPRSGESRREFLQRAGKRPGYVPKAVYEELVDLHDRVDRLEAQLAAVGRDQRNGQESGT